MIRYLPIRWQAIFWARWAKIKFGHTSHFKIEAIRQLRRTSGMTLVQSRDLIDEVMK